MIQQKVGNSYFKVIPQNYLKVIKNLKGAVVNIVGVKAEFRIGHPQNARQRRHNLIELSRKCYMLNFMKEACLN
jgi:antitoxin component of MazEF toxin-antitoxin module